MCRDPLADPPSCWVSAELGPSSKQTLSSHELVHDFRVRKRGSIFISAHFSGLLFPFQTQVVSANWWNILGFKSTRVASEGCTGGQAQRGGGGGEAQTPWQKGSEEPARRMGFA